MEFAGIVYDSKLRLTGGGGAWVDPDEPLEAIAGNLINLPHHQTASASILITLLIGHKIE